MTETATVDTLNDLIETCKDGEYGFQACADHTQSSDIREVFRQRSLACRRAAQELQDALVQHGGQPTDRSSPSGALHRGWVRALGSLPGTTDLAMLEEAERGEDAALARYRKALKEDSLPPELRTLVQDQMAGVQRNHDQLKLLRERYRQAAA